MTCCTLTTTGCDQKEQTTNIIEMPSNSHRSMACPYCGHPINSQEKASSVHDLPGLPAGMKFDPSDSELLQHLEGKVRLDAHKLHPLIDEFIVTIEGDDGICYTHPEKLPGLSKDGLVRHFFHRPSKAYTTGTRKRRKVQTAESDGSETRWHKTGKTRPIIVEGKVKGHKKILVLYTSNGKQKKPEKTNWVMHQYHLGIMQDEKEGELVVSKVFYQTQPRQCGSSTILIKDHNISRPIPVDDARRGSPIAANSLLSLSSNFVEYYDSSSFISFQHDHRAPPTSLVIPNYN